MAEQSDENIYVNEYDKVNKYKDLEISVVKYTFNTKI